MVSIDELNDIERIPLSELPNEIVLKAVREKVIDDVKDEKGKIVKTGGIVIEFITPDKKSITQKYSCSHQPQLIKAMKALGLKDTEELQKAFYVYRKVETGRGFARLYPVAKAKT